MTRRRRWLKLAPVLAVVVMLANGACSGRGGGDLATGDVASAADTGPVAVITEDPTCIEFSAFTIDAGNKLDAGFNKVDASIPASSWSEQTRQAYESGRGALTEYADRVVGLSKKTPHRVMRELYGQLTAYYRAFVAEIDGYTPDDLRLLDIANNAYASLNTICRAVGNQSAPRIASQVAAAAPPTSIAPVGDVDNPQKMLTATLELCPTWAARNDLVYQKTSVWETISHDNPASKWNSLEKTTYDKVAQLMARSVYEVNKIGRSSGNPLVEDFLVLAAQYQDAFLQALPTYEPEDLALYSTQQNLGKLVGSACDSVKG